MIEKLKKEIDGGGEVKGTKFIQIFENDKAYIYKAIHEEREYYEVFEKKMVNKFDFTTKTQLDDKKEKYPKAKDFGQWAFTFTDFGKAKEKYLELTNKKKEK